MKNESAPAKNIRVALLIFASCITSTLSFPTITDIRFQNKELLNSKTCSIITCPTSSRKIIPSCWKQNNVCPSFRQLLKTNPLYAGGFGAPMKKTGKKKNKKKKSLMDIDVKPRTQSPSSQSTPKLDRFGLPIQTAEDIFPPLPLGTELKPAAISNALSTEKEIEDVLKEYLKVNPHFLSKFSNNNEHPMQLRLLHESPPVLSIDNFFTPEECEEYMKLTVPTDRSKPRNLEIQSATFSPLAQSKRTSTTWFCHYSQVSTLLTKVKHLFSDGSSSDTLDIKQMEEPQVVRYRNGEEFSWHYDEIPFHQMQKAGSGGQRIATVLVYLNSIEEGRGGGTIFRDLIRPGKSYSKNSNEVREKDRLTMRPKKGSALIFFPGKLDGTPDERTLHKGEIMKANTPHSNDDYGDDKMIAQMWVHEREYRPQVPPGNAHESAFDSVEQKERELGLFKN